MIVAITGAGGTVGARLVRRHLERGDAVRALSRRAETALPAAVQIYRGDLASSTKELARFATGADVLYHCAAATIDADRMVEVNVEGTRRLVEAAWHEIGRWVQISSIAVYGAQRSGVIAEETPLQPANPYGRSKADADRLLMEAADRGGARCSILRPVKIFGEGVASENNRILRNLISIIDAGLFFFIGKPGAMTHYVHVDNVVEALVRCGAADSAGTRIYNLSDDCVMEQFIEIIASALGKPVPGLRLPEAPVRLLARALGIIPGFPLTAARVEALINRATFPCARMERELSYRHLVPVEQGLRELVAGWKRDR